MVWLVLIDGRIKSPAFTTWEAATAHAKTLAEKIDPASITIEGLTVIGRLYPTDFGGEQP